MDRTIIPNGADPESTLARPLFRQLTQHPEVTLVYVTGRDLHLVEEAISEFELPAPKAIVSDVGTSLYCRKEEDWNKDPEWIALIARDWLGHSHASLRRKLSNHAQLQLQEECRQKEFKLSYYVNLDTDIQALLPVISGDLAELGIKFSLIWSVDELAGTGLLDIIPESATKRHAIEFLMDKLGYDFNETVFAGDSGNDLPVLQSGINSILVANASEEIKNEVRAFFELSGDDARDYVKNGESESEKAGKPSAKDKTVYIAKGGFRGMNGNYCAGLLEGVCHYHPEIRAWLS